MKSKKLFSALLAAAMTLSLAVPAFAVDVDIADKTATAEQKTITIEGDIQSPSIKVTIPAITGNKVILNPYKLEYTAEDDSKSTEQVISTTQYLTNLSDTNVKVSATVTGVATGATFATTAISDSAKPVTTKQTFLYFEIFANDADNTEPAWKAYNPKAANQVLVSAKATTKSDMVVLAKAQADGSVADSLGYAAFRLAGDCAGDPTTPWDGTEAVSVKVAFTFMATSSAAGNPATT